MEAKSWFQKSKTG